MAWLIKLPDGSTFDSDDFLLADVEAIEKGSEVFWSVANPWRSIAVAREFLKAAYRRKGFDDDAVDVLPMRQVKGAFDFSDGGEMSLDPTPTKGRKAPKHTSSRSTSPGAPTGSSGLPPSPGSSG